MIRAGALRHRITIQRKLQVKDRFGSPAATVEWEDVATVWAALDATRGSEFFAAQQTQSTVLQRIRIRYRSDVTSAMRILYQDTVYNVISVLQDNRHKETVLMCEERQAEQR